MKVFLTADDLTGASDSAVQFAKCGLDSRVMLSLKPDDLHNAGDVQVFDTESRDILKDEAYARVLDAVKKVSTLNKDVLFYKKTDSTLRGHVGAELEAAFKASNSNLVLFAPAFVKAGRTTLHGIMYMHGVEIARTELASIPKSPITESYIPKIIAKESSLKCAVLDADILNKGEQAAAEAVREFISQDIQVVICDVTKEEHLDMICSAGLKLRSQQYKVLFAGSAGLAACLGKYFEKSKSSQVQKVSAQKILVLAGSISETTRDQVKVLEREERCFTFKANAAEVVEDPESTAKVDAVKILKQLNDHDVLQVCAAYEASDVEKSAETAKNLGISFFEAGERTAEYMAALAKILSPYFDAMVMTGGDTAVHACNAIDAGSFQILKEVEAGIPLSMITSGKEKGKYLVTKAGAFGTANAFKKSVEVLSF